MRILLVEDQLLVARAVTRALARLEPAPEIVHLMSAPSACEHLIASTDGTVARFDIVLSDYDLGKGGTGADVLAFVRELAVKPQFLFISSNDAIKDLGVPYLEKPSSASQIREAVAAMGLQ